jgi:hypothetical protein
VSSIVLSIFKYGFQFKYDLALELFKVNKVASCGLSFISKSHIRFGHRLLTFSKRVSTDISLSFSGPKLNEVENDGSPESSF